MLLTTDGRMFVYALFCADGCECDDLIDLFEDEAPALAAADRLRRDPEWFGPAGRYGRFGAKHGGPHVELLTVHMGRGPHPEPAHE